MKVNRIKIKDFLQFKDLDLDLTYPKGHLKAGKALDKVCIIGQSGTGKTTLLDLVNDNCCRLNIYGNSRLENLTGSSIIFDIDKKKAVIEDGNFDSKKSTYFKSTDNTAYSLLYFPSALSYYNPPEEHEILLEDGTSNSFFMNKSGLFSTWKDLKHNVSAYQTKETNNALNLAKKAKTEDFDFKKTILKWQEDNPNPLNKIAEECLNPLLKKLHLCVETDFVNLKHLGTLQIKSTVNGNIIPFEKLSTGTKQIIYTAFPIYWKLRKNTIVLMDEPETSLYPDLQREIIPYYTSFDKSNGENTQFFFATHSPIIASCFEPWEIVELKFDAEGNIFRELYYVGENHIDNYTIDPRYLRWDSILQKVFDLDVEGNYEHRVHKLMKIGILKQELEQLKKNGKIKSPEGEQKIQQFKKLAHLLNWQFPTAFEMTKKQILN